MIKNTKYKYIKHIQYVQLIFFSLLLILFLIWYIHGGGLGYIGEKRLETEGNKIIGKIDCYMELNGTPPDSLSEVEINDDDDFPFYYQKIGCCNYILSFALSIDESKTFYSDSRRWEYGYRDIQ